MSNEIKVTVGRVVYYNRGSKTSPENLASIVAKVNDDGSVNLMVVEADGTPQGIKNVRNGEDHCQWDWMPYQKQKASQGDNNSESAEPRP